MDFLDPAKKRAHTIRLFVGYILVAIAIAIASLILLFQSYGYDVDHHTGKVIQNGLIFISAHPSSAEIYLNGTLNKSKTDTKLTVPAGQYVIELRSNGYRPWRRSINLEGGSVERLVYPALFPQNLVTKDVQLYGSLPGFASKSPDRHWLVVEQPGLFTKFDNFDLSNINQPPTVLSLPAGVATEAPGDHSITLVEWSTDNRHVMLKHTFATGSEFIMLDRENPALSFNINKLLNANPTAITLRDKHYDSLYIYDAPSQALQIYDVKAKQLTPFLSKVLTYKTYGADQVLYATPNTKDASQTDIKLWDNGAAYLMRTFAGGTDFLLEMTRYAGNWYMIVSPKWDGHVYIYKNPQDSIKSSPQKPLTPVSILKLEQPQFLSFSDSAQFIEAQNGPKFAVYDIETDRRYYYDQKDQVPIDQRAVWMDGDRLLLVLNGKTTVFDYDGINQQTLAASSPGLLPYFDRDYTALYNIAPSTVVPGGLPLPEPTLKLRSNPLRAKPTGQPLP